MSLLLRCQDLASGGRAVARTPDGRVVFVSGACPGELVEATVETDKGRFLEAKLDRVVEPSADRVEPRCRHFGDCGGCSWQYLSYPSQLAAKTRILEDALRRIGKLGSIPAIVTVGSENPWGTRNRAQLQPSGAPGMPWGFFAAGSRRTVPLAECPVLADELQGLWRELSEVEGDPWADRGQRSAFAYGAQGRCWVRLPGRGDAGPAEVDVMGRTLRFAPDGFFQSHLGLVPRMVREVLAEDRGEEAWDLYSGVGLFAAHLQDRFRRVHAVESDPLAARYAQTNIGRAVHHRQDVESWLERKVLDGVPPPDLVVVDPPRQGLTGRALRSLVEIAPGNLRYVSCGHDTLARDLGRIVAEGWRLEKLLLLDLYPQTPHMETVASLVRS
ncbi:MAG TPA: TRAM domain-containing protein [Fibrobacteria bacterium]|nr:TRAM domain-containing protein [Fibrobacteria bacterium]